jgi:hypothetical protein
MAHAYIPGLLVTRRVLVRKRRILPLKGEVLVKAGDAVGPDDVVAETRLPGDAQLVNVAGQLGVAPEEVPDCMLKKEGDTVAEGEVVARAKSFFGLMKSAAKANMTGTIENVSSVTGQVLLRGAPLPVQVKAYLAGTVAEVLPGEGCVVEAWGSFVQGIFGIGGETHGAIRVVATDPGEVLTEEKIDAACAGKVLVGGGRVTAAALKKAIAVNARGVVAGGFDDRDLIDLLGYDLGVAITGAEEIGITLIVTEGFGEIAMAGKTFDLLRSLEGREASINGATQIRAGVIRPELVVPIAGAEADADARGPVQGLDVGSPVRVIRQPYFGLLGTVTALPPELRVLESGSKARVLEVAFPDGRRAIIPRANVEMLEG